MKSLYFGGSLDRPEVFNLRREIDCTSYRVCKITIIFVIYKRGQKFVFSNKTPRILPNKLKDEEKCFKTIYHVPIPKTSSFLNKVVFT